jgi:ACR3 family arsenite efflux pump ArsB
LTPEGHIQIALFLGFNLTTWQLIEPIGEEKTRFWTGIVSTLLLWVCLGAPVAHLKRVLALKDSSDMSLPYILISLLVSILWMIYGLFLDDATLIVQNLVSTLACAAEFLIYLVFWLYRHPSYTFLFCSNSPKL